MPWKKKCVSSIVMIAACLSIACDEKKSEPTSPADKKPADEAATVSQAQEPDEVEEPAAAKPVEPLDLIDEARVKQAVEAWVASQNASDFEAYKASYATRFTGIKRVGPKQYAYNRTGWIKDRERMFKKKMSVTFEDMNVALGTNSVVVQGVQTWASGDYKDVGPKRLVLVPEGDSDELKITREEMLFSSVVGQDTRPAKLETGMVGMTMSGGRDDLLVLPMLAGEDLYNEAEVKSIERARSAVAPGIKSKMPQDVQQLDGQKVRVFDDSGKACEMKIEGFSVVAEAVPHFGQVQTWDADPMMVDDGERASDEEVGRGIMGLAESSGRYIAANLVPVGEACKGWTWGSVKADVEASAFKTLEDKSMREEVLGVYRSLPGYQKIQKDYVERTGSKTMWSAENGGPKVTSATLDGRTFIFISSVVGHGCDDFLGEFWALYEQGSDFVLLSDAEAPGPPIVVHSVTNLDGDESFEFVGPTVLVQPAGPVWRMTHEREVPFLDCPC